MWGCTSPLDPLRRCSGLAAWKVSPSVALLVHGGVTTATQLATLFSSKKLDPQQVQLWFVGAPVSDPLVPSTLLSTRGHINDDAEVAASARVRGRRWFGRGGAGRGSAREQPAEACRRGVPRGAGLGCGGIFTFITCCDVAQHFDVGSRAERKRCTRSHSRSACTVQQRSRASNEVNTVCAPQPPEPTPRWINLIPIRECCHVLRAHSPRGHRAHRGRIALRRVTIAFSHAAACRGSSALLFCSL